MTQTELGEYFGLSAITIGKLLVELNLRNESTKLATSYAIKRKLAKNVTYNKKGQKITLSVWENKAINYITQKTQDNAEWLAEMLLGRLKFIKQANDNDEGEKIDQLYCDARYEEFDTFYQKIKQNKTVLRLFVSKLHKAKLFSYAEDYLSVFNEIEEITRP